VRNFRFSTVILFLVLSVLAIASTILFTAVYSGAEKALEHNMQLTYERDQRTLSSLMAAEFNNIQQISQELSNSYEIHQGLSSKDTSRIAELIDGLLADRSGLHIDALVVEDNNGSSTVARNVSLLGVQLPLKDISKRDTSPFSEWTSIITTEGGKHYSLLHLSLPVIDEQFGEVIGKLHTFVLLNNNFWIVNQLQGLFGSQAISLSAGNLILDGLQNQTGQLQVLRSAQLAIDKAVFSTEHNTFRTHYLRIGNSDKYKVGSLLSDSAQLVLKDAYITNLYYAAILVAILGIAAMLAIKYMITRALNQVTQYAEQVPQSGLPSPFRGGHFHEFIRVGNAVEKMLLRIRDRDKQLSSIIDNSPNLIFIRDLQHNFRLVNKPFAKVLGMTQGQLLGKQEQGLLSDDLLALLRKADQQVLDNHRPIQYEIEIETNNGLSTFLMSKFPILDDQNTLYSIGGIATDITHIKRTKDQLRLAHQVFSETAEAIIVLDDQQKVLSSNRAFVEMSGFDERGTTMAIQSFLAAHPDIRMKLQHGFRWQGEGSLACFDGSTLPVLVSVTRLSSEGGGNRYVILFNNITKLKAAEQRLERLALYDDLTGLPNRSLFKQRLDEALNSDSALISAVLFIDLDYFKKINDTYGHSVGDQLLRRVAERLRTSVQIQDTVARLGGDEFTVILREVGNREQIKKIAQRILTALSKPYELGSLQCSSSASIGISLLTRDSADMDTLIRNADQAMYQAKQRGRDVIQFFDAELNEREQRLYFYEKELHQALGNKDLFVQYQPRFNVEGQKVLGAEALVRWRHPELGLIPPSEFIPIAESSHLINEIGRFVLFEACQQAAAWNAEGYQIPISVNLSPRQLSSSDFVQDISAALNNADLPADLLELEITETHVMENIKQVLPLLNQIKEMGIKLSIDDFGTGYSSLMYLKRLPIDILKIDRSFIIDIPGDADGENLVAAIIQMAHSLRMRVVAEGVETKQQQHFLRDNGCDELQGFLLGEPGSAEQLKVLASFQRSSGKGYEGENKISVIDPY